MTATAQNPPHMLGGYAPVPDEITVTELPITGTIPPALTGWYLRNGPNPREAASAHWFLGDGMVHGVRIEGGRAASYRNRWVRTKTFTGAPVEYGDGRDGLTHGFANTHVVRHADRILALVESSYPYELACETGRELETVGVYDFGGRLRTPMTAHPKICPTTGELHFYGYGGIEPPYLTYHRADAAGELTVSRPIEVSAHTMMHDFHLTAGHVVFMDLPVVFDEEHALSGAPGMPYRWTPDYGARLGVLRRDDPHGVVRWFEIEPCYVFHTLNAHEDEAGRRLVLHGVRYDSLGDGVGVTGPGSLWRWTIDLAAGTVREERLDDRPAEFPRIDDRLAGLEAAFGHAVDDGIGTGAANAVSSTAGSGPGSGATAGAIHRYDLHRGTTTSHLLGPGRMPGEAVFVPADDVPGGDGWLMAFVYNAATDRSDLVILDAEDLAAPPVAEIHLPRRVPAGFHGNWLPDEL